jgi:hypothetical protein
MADAEFSLKDFLAACRQLEANGVPDCGGPIPIYEWEWNWLEANKVDMGHNRFVKIPTRMPDVNGR